ncbi:hypothetical protein M3Y97_01049800 [Aphelenchoides bicaudatus]|nr:hypothetical protein M3Y97_01049800 [Aphelenchoides bicaudatus]
MCNVNYFPTTIYNNFHSACILSTYFLTIYFAIQTVRELKRQTALKINQNAKFHKQIGRVLFVQSLIPLAVSILPITIPRILIALNIPIGYYYFDFNAKVIMLFPLLNSLSTLIFVIPYRKFILKVLRSVFIGEIKTSIVVDVTQNNNNQARSSNRLVTVS